MANPWCSFSSFLKWDSRRISLNYLYRQEFKTTSVLLSIACDSIRLIAAEIKAADSERKTGKIVSWWDCQWITLFVAGSETVCMHIHANTFYNQTWHKTQINRVICTPAFYWGCVFTQRFRWPKMNCHWSDLLFGQPRAEGGTALFGDSVVLDGLKLIMGWNHVLTQQWQDNRDVQSFIWMNKFFYLIKSVSRMHLSVHCNLPFISA